MATRYGKRIVTDGLVLCLDAADNISAPHNDLPVKQGCIGWYDGDDDTVFTYSSGTAVSEWRDKSGNSNHLTMSNGPTRSVTQNSKSGLAFNGSSQWGNAVTGGAISETTMIAVCSLATLTPSGSNSGGGVVSVNQHSADNFNAIVYNEYTAKRWMNGSSSFARTPNTVSTSDETSTGPHIISNAIKTGAFNLYRNGTNLTSTSYTYSAQTNGKIVIGNRHTNSSNNPVSNGYWYGNIYEVIVYDRVLSSDELTKVHNYLQNKWNIEVSDSKWYDRTANAYNGTPTNGPTYSETNKGYFDFDGTDQYINCGSTAGNFGTDPFTVSIWLKFDAITSFFNKRAADQDQILFSYSSGKPYFIYNAPNGTDYGYRISNTSLATGTWYNLVATVDRVSNYPVIYVNGANDGSSLQSSAGSPTTANMDNGGNLLIGTNTYANTTFYFNGQMSQVLLYKNKALSAAEVLQNYNAIKGRYL